MVKRSPAVVVVPYFTKLSSVTALKTFAPTVESRNSNLCLLQRKASSSLHYITLSLHYSIMFLNNVSFFIYSALRGHPEL